jgi:hypothetical protein
MILFEALAGGGFHDSLGRQMRLDALYPTVCSNPG